MHGPGGVGPGDSAGWLLWRCPSLSPVPLLPRLKFNPMLYDTSPDYEAGLGLPESKAEEAMTRPPDPQTVVIGVREARLHSRTRSGMGSAAFCCLSVGLTGSCCPHAADLSFTSIDCWAPASRTLLSRKEVLKPNPRLHLRRPTRGEGRRRF